MSVITYHEVSNEGKDLFDRLKEEGIIHEGKIYSPRRHDYVQFENVFDYKKCDKKTLRELDERTRKQDERYWNNLQENKELSDTERAFRFGEVQKCDVHLMPVSKSSRGGVVWTLNYAHDDLPSIAIGRKYPNEVLEYLESTEGKLYVHCLYKKDKDIKNLMEEVKDEKPELPSLKPDEKQNKNTNVNRK